MPESKIAYPNTKVQPTPNSIGGIEYEDAFQWLEGDDPDVIEWQEEQNALTSTILHKSPYFSVAMELVKAQSLDPSFFLPRRFDDLWFSLRLPKGSSRRALEVSKEPSDEGTVLIDPSSLEGGQTSLDWFYPSPKATYVAYGLSQSGNEQTRLHLLETRTGRHLPDSLPHILGLHSSVAWLPDESGFFYAAIPPQATDYRIRIFFHKLGESARTEPEDIPDVPYPYMIPGVSADGRYAVAFTGLRESRPFFIRELSGERWSEFLASSSGTFTGRVIGENFIALTTQGAPRGRVVSIPINSGNDPSTWQVLIPESEAVIRSAEIFEHRIVIVELVDTISRMRVFSMDGQEEGEVSLPEAGTVIETARASRDGSPKTEEQVIFAHTSFESSPGIYSCRLSDRRIEELKAPYARHAGIKSELRFCDSRDGTRIPFHVVKREDLQGPGPHPTLVYAYGGWNHSLVPTFLTGLFAGFVRAGGVLIQASLRGGGEYGSEWWAAGRLDKKQNTMDDLYAVTESLIEEGVAESSRLAFFGNSNGGMLAGALANQRPELFRAIAGRVPIFDLLRLLHTPMSLAIALSDYGDPRDADQARTIYSYSPYHNVKSVPYPAMLIVSGESDPRCPAWHARKMAALLQSKTTSEFPILLRVTQSTGHGPASSSVWFQESVEILTFLLQQLEMQPSE